MVFDRAVLLDVFPVKYHTDVYDIVNIFYKGVIRRGNHICYGVADSDIISVSYTGDRCEIKIYFCARDGYVAESGNVAPERSIDTCECQTCFKTLVLFEYGKSVAYSIKMALYRSLKMRAHYEQKRTRPLPWGALVGVRPVKLYSDLLDRGMSQSAIIDDMAWAYDIPEDTSLLCLKIATAQNPILRAYSTDKDCMLYIGIPFCVSKCVYCSFPSDAHNKIEIYAKLYLDALLKEIGFIAGYIKAEKRRIRAVYIGGGTPTALETRELEKLVRGVADIFTDVFPDEITIEAGRADTINKEKLVVLLDAARITGRLRLCINPQTMNERTLRLIGRNHTPEDVINAFWLAREAGFNDINMDIIAGLPGEDICDFTDTLTAILKLRPESITSHTLCIKRSSRLNEFGKEYVYPDSEEVEKMQAAARNFSVQMGMTPYYLYRQKNTIGNLANVGYAINGRECIYNIHEMADRIDVFAAGAGAVSKFMDAATGCIERVFNVKNLLEYISRSDEMIDRKKRYLTRLRKE